MCICVYVYTRIHILKVYTTVKSSNGESEWCRGETWFYERNLVLLHTFVYCFSPFYFF